MVEPLNVTFGLDVKRMLRGKMKGIIQAILNGTGGLMSADYIYRLYKVVVKIKSVKGVVLRKKGCGWKYWAQAQAKGNQCGKCARLPIQGYYCP